MDSQPRLLPITAFLMLIMISFVVVLGRAWRLPLILIGMGARTMNQWTSSLGTNVSFPVPNEEDEDYLETRSYA